MRRFLYSLFLISVLIGPFVGTYSWLEYQKKGVKKSVKKQIIEGLDEKELIHLTFTKKQTQEDLRWEHSHEFEYQGHMYDIVRSEIRGDSMLYICWLDKEETVLNTRLNKIIAQNLGNNPQNQQKQEQLIQFFKTLICEEIDEFKFAIEEFNNSISGRDPKKYCGINFSPPSPPPQWT